MGINVDNDTSKQSKGVWTQFGGSKFLVGASAGTKFQRALNRLQAPYRKKIEKGTLDPKVSKEILCKAMSEGLVFDWADVEDKDKNQVPFSAELCEKALANNDDLREYVLEFAQDQENFRSEQREAMGN